MAQKAMELAERRYQLHNISEQYARDMLFQKSAVDNLEEACAAARAEMREERMVRCSLALNNTGGDGAMNKNLKRIAQLTKFHEIKLQEAKRRLTGVENENRELRLRINELRGRRVQNDAIHDKLERALKRTVVDMNRSFEESTRLAAERELLVQQRFAVTSANMSETQEHEQTITGLAAFIESEHRKTEETLDKATKMIEKQRLVMSQDQDEHPLRVKLATMKQHAQMDRSTAAELDRSLSEQANAMEVLKQHTKSDTIEQVVETFIVNEDENFAMFKFIQDINDECEAEDEATRAVQAQIAKLQAGELPVESQVATKYDDAHLERLREELAAARSRADAFGKLRRQRAGEFESLAQSVHKLYMLLGCDTMGSTFAGAGPLLTPGDGGGGKQDSGGGGGGKQEGAQGSSAAAAAGNGITEGTLVQYFGIVEERATEIIGDFSDAAMRKALPSHYAMDPSLVRSGPVAPKGDSPTKAMRLHLPDFGKARLRVRDADSGSESGGGSSDDDSDAEGERLSHTVGGSRVKPFTREEMKRHAAKLVDRSIANSPHLRMLKGGAKTM